jgi:hypothetical protein
MGRRSRKRASDHVTPTGAPAAEPPAADRPVRRTTSTPRWRARSEDRPPAPWGNFPLGEIVTLCGLVVLVTGFATTSFRLLALGFSLVALSAVELSIREHFAGFRSHSSLLALVSAALVGVLLIAVQAPRTAQIAAAAGVLAGAFVYLRRVFRRRSGGLGFRA